MPDRSAAVKHVLAALDLTDADLMPLGEGLASEAWRIGTGEPWFALRIGRTRQSDATFEMEHALMGRLAGSGARVPRPVRGSWQVEGWAGPPFSLTTGLQGAPLEVADHSRAVPVLAVFLHLLHEQAIDGYGPLVVDAGRLLGRQPSMTAGLMAWARRPLWPLGDVRLVFRAISSLY